MTTTMTAKWIDIASDDGNFQAYLSLPRAGTGPGIVLLQEIFGVNAHIRSVADQYAADGYVVLVPDLFWRSQAHAELSYDGDDMQTAYRLMQALDSEKTLSDIALTASALRALPGVDAKIAAIGYCMGGRLAYNAAARGMVDAAIAYYGGGIQNQLELAQQLKTPIQFHFGEQDGHIPMDAIEQVRAAFKSHAQATFHTYPQADHGFNCSHRASYQQRAAALAHGHSLLFLGQYL